MTQDPNNNQVVDPVEVPTPETATVNPTIELPTAEEPAAEGGVKTKTKLNEDALLDLYNLANEAGFKSNIVRFHEKLNESPDMMKDVYALAQGAGYNGSQERLMEIVGVNNDVSLKKQVEKNALVDIFNMKDDLALAGLNGEIKDEPEVETEALDIEGNRLTVEEAQEGKGDLTATQSSLNSFANAYTTLRGWDNRLGKAYGAIVGDLEMVQANDLELKRLGSLIKPVYEPTDVIFSDGVDLEDFQRLGAATIGALTGFGVSMVERTVGQVGGAIVGAAAGAVGGLAVGSLPGAAAGIVSGATIGSRIGGVAGFTSDMIASEIIAYNEAKAKEMGIPLEQLLEQGDGEIFIPSTFGLIEGQIERFQLKGLSKVFKAAPNSFKDFFVQLFVAGGENGLQELGQGIGNVINEEMGKVAGRNLKDGTDDNALRLGFEAVIDPKNRKLLTNATLNGVLGGKGSVIMGTTKHVLTNVAPQQVGKLVTVMRTPKQYEQQEEIIGNLNEIHADRSNPDLTQAELEALDQAEKANLDQVRDIQEENLQVIERMEETEITRAEEIYKELDKISENIKSINNAAHISELNKRKYAGPLNSKIGELTTELSNLRKVAKERPEPIQAEVAVAPFYEQEINNVEEAANARTSEDYQVYIETINDAAQVTGIKINGIDQAIGGYYLQKLDKPITEISNVVKVEADNLDQVSDFAALLGALTPETQEATIAAQEVNEDDPNFNSDVYTVKTSDAQKTLDALKKAGITDFTLNETENTVTLYQPHEFRTPDFVAKMGLFTQELENNNVNYEATQKTAAQSRYIDSNERKQILSNVRESALQKGAEGELLRNKVEQAIINNAKFNEEPLAEDQQAANKLSDLLGDQPLFSKGSNDQVNAADVEAIRQEMDAMDEELLNYTIPSDLTTKEVLDYESLQERFGDNIPVLEKADLNAMNGIPFGFTISDQLYTGSLTNPDTGNSHELDGGIGFNGKEQYKDLAWAVVKPNGGQAPINNAIQIYQKNKELFDRVWRKGTVPYGHVPIAILKMGQTSMQSNEAVFRVAADNIKTKFPERNRKRALTTLVGEIKKMPITKKFPESRKARILEFLGEHKTIDQAFENITDLESIGQRTPIFDRVFLGKMELDKDPKPGTPGKPTTIELLKGQPEDSRKYVHAQHLNRLIQEPATKNIPDDHVIGITSINVLNPESSEIGHKNYKGGIKGKALGVLRNPVHAADVFPEMYAKSIYTYKPNKSGKLPSQKVAVSQAVASSGAVAVTKAFRGAKLSEKMDAMSQLMGKLKLAFPGVTVIDSKQEFEDKLGDPSIQKFVRNGEVVYGFTTTDNGSPKVFLNPDYKSTKLALHEYGHIWMDFLRQNNKDLLDTGFSLLEGTSALEKAVLEHGNTQLAREEAMAELIANRGETIIEASNKSAFVNWLTGVFNYIKKNFKGFVGMSAEEVQNMTLEDFVDGSLSSMLSGEEIKIQDVNVRFSKTGIQEIINLGLKNAIPESGIKLYLKENGYDADQINRNYDALVKEYQEKGAVREKLFDPKQKPLVKFLDNIYRRALSAKGYRPASMQVSNEYMEGSVQANLAQAKATATKLNKAAQGVSNVEDVVAQIDKLMRGETYNLPKSIEDIALDMRKQVDVLSKAVIEGGFALTKANKAKLELSMGSYLTRSYRVFDIDNWNEELQASADGEKIINAAYNYISAQESTQKKAQQLAEETLRPYDTVLDEIVNRNIQDILNKNESSRFVKASREGAKDLNALKYRKDVPQPIRALMGEYTDPIQNFQRTVLRVSSLLESMKYLDRVKKAGYNVFLFDKNDSNKPAEYNTEIASESTDSYSPLSGLFTTPEIAKAIKNEPLLSGKLAESALYRSWVKGVGTVKFAKTILSPGTHGKNVIGNLFFMAMNGYTSLDAYKIAWQEVHGRLKALELDELTKRYDKLLRLGVVDQSVVVNELNEMFGEENMDQKIESILERKQNAWSKEEMLKMSSWVKKGEKFVTTPLQKAYQLEDDYFKIVSFEMESKRIAQLEYQKDYNKLTEKEREQVDEMAAEKTKNLLPNYSRIGQLGLVMKALPLFGTFISFQLESYRTAYNTMSIAMQELKNPKMRQVGAKRIVGTVAVQAFNHYLLNALGQMLVPGTDTDEPEDREFIKLVMPHWAKNSEKVLISAGDGKFTYIDLSASNPHGQIERAFNAVVKGTDPKDAAVEFFMEAFGPFVTQDILMQTITSLANNKNGYGKPIYRTDDSAQDIFSKTFTELYRAFEPGIVRSASKIAKADNKVLEFLGQMTGYKPQTVDYAKQMYFAAREIQDEVRDMAKYSAAKRQYKEGLITKEQRNDVFESTQAKKLKVYEDAMKLYNGAIHFGVSPKDAREALKSAGIPKYIISQIRKGKLTRILK